MSLSLNINPVRIYPVRLLVTALLLIMNLLFVTAQEPPPRPVTVTPLAPGLGFGTFSHGATGGTITVTAAGGISATGDIILLSIVPFYSVATFEIVGNQGTVISILNGPDIALNRVGGGSMNLHIGDTSPLSPFVLNNIYPTPTLMTVGGTLTVGPPASNPPGAYSGTFNITFIQE